MEGQHPARRGTDEVRDDRAVSPLPPLPPPPGRDRHEMYIVQFPKDQVYRVPPRENALIMERYRKPPNARRECGCRCPRLLLTMALILLAVVAVVGMTLATLFFIFNPTGPTFSVASFAVRSPENKNFRPQYEIWLTARNPNDRLGVEYEADDTEVSLLFDNTRVAMGKFPTFEQDSDAYTRVRVELIGSNRPLPREMNRSMNDDKWNRPIALDLDMRLGVRITVAGLRTWVMKSEVACEFELRNLRNDTRVLSQVCHTHFKQY